MYNIVKRKVELRTQTRAIYLPVRKRVYVYVLCIRVLHAACGLTRKRTAAARALDNEQCGGSFINERKKKKKRR